MPAPKVASALHPRAKPRTRALGIVPAAGLPAEAAPKCPAKLGGLAPLATTVEIWDRLWLSPVANVIDLHSDLASIERWAALIDERERVFRAFRKQRLVEGSQGQPVLNPLWTVLTGCESRLQALEDRIGLTPRARLMLGITYAEAGKSLDELNRMLADEEEGEDADVDDPRLSAIDASAS